ncbi:synaptic vesicle glycoprotein 2B-like [Drosophila innubila]|uniref:synaptic vesicle glycoprotein 2B-like n=1 Tax=Drosophila innubila TaxID=198719 RepID=UPI00148BC0E9|nr:synaptic vesicle glycoprotein 2B-like [Drosophila innubila]
MAEVNIDDVLNVLGFGRMQLILFISCATQQMYISNEQFGLGLVSVAASCDFQIDEHRMAWLMTAVFIAQVGSSHYLGYKSDEIGRRKLILISSMLTMLFSLISSFMPDFWSFLVVRFITSCFLPGPGSTVLTYMSEFTQIKLRPEVTNFLSYALGVSMIYVPLVSMWLLPLNIRLMITDNYGFTSWRALMVVNLLPGVISWIMIFCMPESPKYYLSINQVDKALEVLERCCRYNKGKDVTLKSLGFENVSQPRLRGDSYIKHNFLFIRMWSETKPLLQGMYLRHMLLIIAILIFEFGTGFGLAVWMPRILKMQSDVGDPMILCDLVEAAHALNKTVAESECNVPTKFLLYAIFNGCCCLAMFMLISLLLIWINRKIILLAFAMLATIAGFMLNVVKTHFFVTACFVFLTVPPLCSLRLILSVLIDVIPTHLRNKSVALAMMFGRIGVLFAGLYVGYTLKWNCYLTFNAFAAVMLISFVLITRLPSDADVIDIATK